jgi:hypothetical protein
VALNGWSAPAGRAAPAGWPSGDDGGVGAFRTCHPGTMKTVYEAAGGRDGLVKLAGAWHARVLADEVVSHAFSQWIPP